MPPASANDGENSQPQATRPAPKNGRVVIEDLDHLQEAGEFDPTYLHRNQAA